MAKVQIVSKKDPSRTKMVSRRDANILVKLGRWDFSGATPAPPTGTLGEINFASRAALDRALANKLTPDLFRGLKGSGRGGAFTVGDVMKVSAQP